MFSLSLAVSLLQNSPCSCALDEQVFLRKFSLTNLICSDVRQKIGNNVCSLYFHFFYLFYYFFLTAVHTRKIPGNKAGVFSFVTRRLVKGKLSVFSAQKQIKRNSFSKTVTSVHINSFFYYSSRITQEVC